MRKLVFAFLALFTFNFAFSQMYTLKIAKLKYNGGGDWYANKTSLPNLINFCNKNLKTNIFPEEDIIEPGDKKLFQYPFVHMTGHGNVTFSEQEAKNLRNYLIAGGFLHIDDNYGLNQFARREMKKVFPEHDFVEIPFSHPIYHQKYQFNKGLPKIHEHDNKPPQGFGIIHEGKLVCFFTFECDLGNGWEDQSIYNDPESTRQEALKMGANLVQFAFTNY
ncbi:DUF4159 domain-containing protein [Lacihabitans sp. LS3-19]|uniref:DUF4159 domain-containing protein n=1 Tax=Lacihabitans sp. LS3-19 TaxID=2487335 RepID=UPI0020CC66B8|nr:DUF4159 domain-containing protein [Lacihabitans sp. LS3-19]MCP9769818.1 DUF4159 domain-containing protein [Lacihabitans sp. LS3-19]